MQAAIIYTDHLDPSAQDQVNVDEDTRLAVQREVSNAEVNCFDRAQKHVNTEASS